METALFTAKEDATIKPGEQVVLAVAHSERDFEGLVSRAGLVTSVRDFTALTNGYGVPYVYGKDMNKILVTNFTTTTMRIKKGCTVAEFHQQSPTDLVLLSENESDATRHSLNENFVNRKRAGAYTIWISLR